MSHYFGLRSGRFQSGGRGSLSGLMPYKDANAVVVEMADEVLPVSHQCSQAHTGRLLLFLPDGKKPVCRRLYMTCPSEL